MAQATTSKTRYTESGAESNALHPESPSANRVRRHRARRARGVTCARVDVTDAQMRMLEENGYLKGGRDGLGAAIALFLSDHTPLRKNHYRAPMTPMALASTTSPAVDASRASVDAPRSRHAEVQRSGAVTRNARPLR